MTEFLRDLLIVVVESFASYYAAGAAEHLAERHWSEPPKPKRAKRKAPTAPKRGRQGVRRLGRGR